MPENCAAIVIAAKHHELIKVKDTRGTTHTIGALRCKFEFRTNDWLNSAKTAMFCNGDAILHPEVIDNAIAVPLDSDDECPVPYEVLTDTLPYSIGVWGVTNSGLRIVSKWLVFNAQQGCYTEGNAPEDPEPTIYEQILGIAQGALNAANEVLSRADNGEFDGVSVTHSWDGSILTLNSASGTTSTDLVGPKGDQGNGIAYITKTSTDGLVDTYIITFTNGTTTSFTVNNGAKGESGGYYKPILEEDGTLIFAPSKSDMLPVGSVGNIKGQPGYTPQKGVDYFDGNDGVSVVAVRQSVVSTEDGGDNVITAELSNGATFDFVIKNGQRGDPGEPGANGKSAYEYAQDGGYTGTEEEFANKLASDGGSSAPSDWNANEGEKGYVQNRTHYEEVVVYEPINITWDGNTEGLVQAGGSYKVSDLILTKEYLKTCTIIRNSGATMLATDVSWNYGIDAIGIDFMYIVSKANASCGSTVFSEPGIYFLPNAAGLMSDGLTEVVVHQLDEKYVPDTVARKSEIPELVQSDWNQCDECEPDYIKNKTHGETMIIHDSVTEEVIASSSKPTGYGTLPKAFCIRTNVQMPEGKYILITVGGETKKITTVPTKVGSAYREEIMFDNGIKVQTRLTATEPLSGMADRKNFYYQVLPLADSETIDRYIGTQFTVQLISGDVKQLDEKFIPDTIARVADIENTYALKTDLENVSVDLSAYETTEAAQAKLDEAKAYTDEAMASISIELITMDEIDEICGPNMTDDNDGNIAVVSVFNDQRVSYNDGNVSVESIFNDNDVTFDDEGNVTIGGL